MSGSHQSLSPRGKPPSLSHSNNFPTKLSHRCGNIFLMRKTVSFSRQNWLKAFGSSILGPCEPLCQKLRPHTVLMGSNRLPTTKILVSSKAQNYWLWLNNQQTPPEWVLTLDTADCPKPVPTRVEKFCANVLPLMSSKYPWGHSVPGKLKIGLQIEYVSNAALLVHVGTSKQQAYFVRVFPSLLLWLIINPNAPQSLHKGNCGAREEVRRPDWCCCPLTGHATLDFHKLTCHSAQGCLKDNKNNKGQRDQHVSGTVLSALQIPINLILPRTL